MTNYILRIEPAILVEQRHRIQDLLEEMGFKVYGGGTDTDLSACDISFSLAVLQDNINESDVETGVIARGDNKI